MGIELCKLQIEQFYRYYRELIGWNTRVNLTTVTDWNLVQTRHFLDSLSLKTMLSSYALNHSHVIDVGSGAGFPGIPLKIAYPNLELTLVDSVRKKTAFLEHVSQALDLHDVTVITGRAETLAHNPSLRAQFDLVTSRALAKLPVLAELTLPFCRLNGLTVLHKGPNVSDELISAHDAISKLGGHLCQVADAPIFPLSIPGRFVTIKKKKDTLDLYPRRPGVPSKRPL